MAAPLPPFEPAHDPLLAEHRTPRARPPAPAPLVDGWRSPLHSLAPAAHHDRRPTHSPNRARHHHDQGYSYGGQYRAQGGGGGGGRASRPPSGVSSSNRLSSNPSLLSLEQQHGMPTSPATTVDPYSRYPPAASSSASLPYPPQQQQQQQRHSSAHPSAYGASLAPPGSGAASRSHQSLPAFAAASGEGGRGGRSSRSQHHRSYDPEFDRSASAGSSASATATLAQQGGPRELFNPNAPPSQQQQQQFPPQYLHQQPYSPHQSHFPHSATAPPTSSAAALSAQQQQQQQPPSLPRSRRERELREDGTVRRPRSKREPVDLADLGRRAGSGSGTGSRGAVPAGGEGSKESLESVETDFSGRTKSSGGGGGGGGRRRRRREDGEDGAAGGAGDGDEALFGGAAGGSGKNRQLFDPRRDDPMRFAEARAERAASRAASKADARSVLSFRSDLTGGAGGGESSVGGGADDAASILTAGSAPASSSHGGSAGGRKKEPHPAMAQLKRAYREILDLETRLQEENRAVQAATLREVDAEEGVAPSKGVRIQGGTGVGGTKRFDDEYWVKLANGHKQLADAHYSFLQLALDPRLPASLHSLAQRYNIPTRLWQVAFHQLLERMRHAVLAGSLASSSGEDGQPQANVLEHLIEFIEYAYRHYSQLFEDPTVAVFRAAWIEQLGDLARYRMAVAGLASRMHAASSAANAAAPTRLSAAALEADEARPPRPADAASIGQAALGDWELEEQETWREMARDWYGQGLAENPGTGRLQHHLALLSKGDEMRALYHYAKSLTAAHPYLSARESILPLFEDEHQARRTQPDVTKAELFVHLHGMLFTKISLDDFPDCFERFLERLKEELWALQRARDDWPTLGSGAAAPFSDREWFMLGIINISALLQYGAEDGVLKKLMARDSPAENGDGGSGGHHGSSRSSGRSAHRSSSRHGGASTATLNGGTKSRAAPQAIMVKRSDADAGDDETERASSTSASTVVGGGDASDVVKQLNPFDGALDSPEDDPLVFKLAQRLSFSLLSFLIDAPFRPIGTTTVPNPYVTLLVTFLAHLSHHPSALKHLERAIPWSHLAALFNAIPSSVEVRLDTPSKLVGGRPLPEDWCLRGMDWAGRQLFGRGYWREHRHRAAAAGGFGGDGLPPPIEGVEGATVRVESEMDALKFDLAALEDAAAASSTTDDEPGAFGGPGASGAAVQLAESRWRRLAICAAWLVRNVPGFDYDVRAIQPRSRFRVSGTLQVKLERWAQEDEDEREAERLSRLSIEEKAGGLVGGVDDEDSLEESDGEDDENEGDSIEVKELKARRRQLKAIIRSARTATRSTGGHGGLTARLGSKAASLPKVFPGYTVLVFDTNILLTSIKLFSELVAAECWTVVVPLAVITELDGLKRQSTPLGFAAAEVIDYLELAIRGYSRFLKIQTSRGNYLKDLAIRNESIDFSESASLSADGFSSHDVARSMDDVILRAVTWQRDHFTNRVALVNPRAQVEKRKVPSDAAQVVLVTFDRNLRLKARARGLETTDEKGLKKAVEAATSAPSG
ncbi:uncharacterized protein JCM10292_001450 [Rhodotorula paludigena]|uniref:uncharacterized protein n=1 Tax=Rhodotorula paludigena TaxID=86838 RepID=UPI00317670E8